MWDRALLRSRNWGWLRERIFGLLRRPASWVAVGDRAVLNYTTRTQEAVYGPSRDAELETASSEQHK